MLVILRHLHSGAVRLQDVYVLMVFRAVPTCRVSDRRVPLERPTAEHLHSITAVLHRRVSLLSHIAQPHAPPAEPQSIPADCKRRVSLQYPTAKCSCSAQPHRILTQRNRRVFTQCPPSSVTASVPKATLAVGRQGKSEKQLEACCSFHEGRIKIATRCRVFVSFRVFESPWLDFHTQETAMPGLAALCQGG